MRLEHLCWKPTQIAKFMGPTRGPPGSYRPQMGPMLTPWTFLSRGFVCAVCSGCRRGSQSQLRIIMEHGGESKVIFVESQNDVTHQELMSFIYGMALEAFCDLISFISLNFGMCVSLFYIYRCRFLQIYINWQNSAIPICVKDSTVCHNQWISNLIMILNYMWSVMLNISPIIPCWLLIWCQVWPYSQYRRLTKVCLWHPSQRPDVLVVTCVLPPTTPSSKASWSIPTTVKLCTCRVQNSWDIMYMVMELLRLLYYLIRALSSM